VQGRRKHSHHHQPTLTSITTPPTTYQNHDISATANDSPRPPIIRDFCGIAISCKQHPAVYGRNEVLSQAMRAFAHPQPIELSHWLEVTIANEIPQQQTPSQAYIEKAVCTRITNSSQRRTNEASGKTSTMVLPPCSQPKYPNTLFTHYKLPSR
jgi:hypothetical protein